MNYYFIFLLILGGNVLSAQSDEHDHHDHDHHKNEIGIANSPVYFVKEKEFSYGLHIHYMQTISDSKFGLGVGVERIFDQHKHNTIGVIGSYRPTEKLSINLSPGITFEDNSKVNFALHFETSYEFEIRNFHIGPALEFAYDPEDYHISLGLHIGYGF
ncbi:MAG: hypothetical protein JKY42_00720 [Flavobacteriales bacterium]|nr:hypothetical protein [Flavobacteriales bacterium]